MKYIKLFENHSDYEDFVSGGTMVKPNVSHCVQENDVHYNEYIDYSKFYFTFESLEDNNIIYFRTSNTATTKTISVSTDDGETWTQYTSSTGGSGTTIATLNNGDKLLLKGNNAAYGNSSYSSRFNSSKNFNVYGNIMSLVSGDSFENATELTSNNNFQNLFRSCSGLISAENLILPALVLTERCYRQMFDTCTNLKKGPKILATTFAALSCNFMFYGCTSLTTAPELSATTLAQSCCSNMFEGCTSLTVAPELPATTLAIRCYNGMFSGCASLTTAPSILPATTLAQNCYSYMFEGCTSLTTAPVLPATTLANDCYENMFESCTSLTVAPELPATTLAAGCYQYMFIDCTSLTVAPELPATTLASWCYANMFSGCTSLTSVATVPNSVKPVSSNYCCGTYYDTSVTQSSDYDESAYELCDES